MWTQYTYKNNVLAYQPKERTSEEIIGLLAQMHFLRQAGEDIKVGGVTDNNFKIVEYTVERRLKDRTLNYRFVKM